MFILAIFIADKTGNMMYSSRGAIYEVDYYSFLKKERDRI